MDATSIDAALCAAPYEARERVEAALAAAGGGEGSIEAAWLRVALDVLDGRYALALGRPLAAALLGAPTPEGAAGLGARAQALVEAHEGGEGARKLVTWVGVACLHCVVRANFTGPPLSEAEAGLVSEAACGWAALSDAGARALLAHEGEEAHRKCGAAWALVGARALLAPPPAALDPSPWAAWWSGRAALLHLRLLSAQTPTLRAAALGGLRRALCALEAAPRTAASDELRAALHLEEAALHALAQCPLEVERAHAAAMEARSLRFELGGEMAVRTKFQARAFAQLCLRAVRLPPAAGAPPLRARRAARPGGDGGDGGPGECAPFVPPLMPEIAQAEDDTLLDVAAPAPAAPAAAAAAPAAEPVAAGAPAGAEPSAAPLPEGAAVLEPRELSPLDQALALVSADMARLRARAHGPAAAAQDEAMVFVSLALRAPPEDWTVRSAALHRRAALDAASSRRQPRALAQLEELALAPARAPEPPALERPSRAGGGAAWCSLMPSVREVALEYGRALAGLGSLAEAVRAFREAGAEEEAAIALAALGRRDEALALLHEALSSAESRTAGCLCTLGDLTQDDAHYRSALELAGGRHFRAALALGASATKRREWAEAEAHLRLALSLRPHAAPVWQHLALCMLRATPVRADEACDALRRAVSLEPDDGQSWALLGSQLSDVPGREADARSALGRASELMPTDALLAGRHVRACCAAHDLEHARSTIRRALALGLLLPKSALHRVYQALGGEGAGPKACPGRLARSGAPSAEAVSLAAAAALAAERRLPGGAAGGEEGKGKEGGGKAGGGDGIDTLGFAVFFHQLSGDVPAEARCRRARLEGLRAQGGWAREAAALAAYVEEAAQLLQVEERLGARRPELCALRRALHAAVEAARDELGASAGYEELRMLLGAVERHVGTGSDDDSDEE